MQRQGANYLQRQKGMVGSDVIEMKPYHGGVKGEWESRYRSGKPTKKSREKSEFEDDAYLRAKSAKRGRPGIREKEEERARLEIGPFGEDWTGGKR